MAKILVVDDDPVMRALLRTRLEDLGHSVAEAADGEKGIAEIRKNMPDLLVTDIVMPQKGGVEAMMEIHTEFPDLKTVVVTGHSPTESEAFQNIVKHFGGAKVFTKPLDMDGFLEVLKELIG